jgi:hypothetical protein
MGRSDEMRALTEHLHEAHEGRREALADLSQAEASRRAEAAEDARQRAEYVDGLRTLVSSMRDSTASRLSELENDSAETHRVWTELSRRTRQARAGVSAAPAAPRATKKARFGRRRA